MADGNTNKALSHEVAEVLLSKISEVVATYEGPNDVLELAQAYATVVDAMPKPPTKPGKATVIR